MSIYTRRGDSGETSLGDGARVSKDSARVEAYGTLDEAISVLGLAATIVDDRFTRDFLEYAQQRLMNCASAIASAGSGDGSVGSEDVAILERFVDSFTNATGPMRQFIVPGGSEPACRLHVARTVVRRAERRVATLHRAEPVDPNVRAFINRLSDALFAAARRANQVAGLADEAWRLDYPAPTDFQ